MKRDMDLIRLLLLRSEGDESAEVAVQAYEQHARAYHVALLIEAGLLLGIVTDDEEGQPYAASVSRLTWAGHEFLDAARDEKAWKTVGTATWKAGKAFTFPLLLEALKALAHRTVWPALGL